jgi:1,4-alpha-glucan branching enzyme
MNELSRGLQEDAQWNNPYNLGVFVDNHDVTRFSRLAGKNARELLKSGLLFVYTIRGFPVFYYGTEVMMLGTQASDWAGREMMPWADITAGKHDDMINYVKKLNAFRDGSSALSRGRMTEVYKDYSVYTYLRTVDGEAVLVVLNKHPEDTDYTFTLPADTGFQGTLKDILSGESFTLTGNQLKMKLKARQSYVFQAKGGKALAAKVVDFDKRMPAGISMVTFRFKAPNASKVLVAGAFNGWDQKSTELVKGADGVFELTIPLKAGKYEYKFIVDGNWTADPDAKENTGPPYGNSIIEVK